MMSRLTPRVRQTVDLVRQGLCNKDIAAKMGIHYRTVKFYLTEAYYFLEVKNRNQLIVKYGVVSAPPEPAPEEPPAPCKPEDNLPIGVLY